MTKEPETRSVGELLRDADILSRQLLFDVTAADGPAMLRTWGEVVEAAAGAWRALPSYPLDHEREAMIMTRLERLSRELHRTLIRDGLLGDGPEHDGLAQIRDRYAAVEDLVTRFGSHVARGHTRPEDVPAVHADVTAARARIMHGLYVASHGVGVSSRTHLESLAPRDDGVHPGLIALQHLSAMENLAGSYVAARAPAAYDGEAHPPPRPVLDRLEHAIARWDIQAHRTLAHSPTPANFTLIARVQADTTATMARIVDAGLRLSTFVGTPGYARRSPTLERTQGAWHQAARRWAEFTPPGLHADRDLVIAAGELRASIREIGDDLRGQASPEVMASRVSLIGAAQALQESLATGVDLAYAASAIAAIAPLEAPARTIATRCAEDLAGPGEATPATGERLAFEMGVHPGHLHANRILPLPDALRDRLVAHMNDIVRTAIDAVSATAWLDQPATDTTRDPMALTRARPRGVQERLPMDYSPGSPATPGYPGR